MPATTNQKNANIARFVDFICEREFVRINKESGAPRPWTKDPILHKYRFCNVDRNDDPVTKWIHQHIIGLYPGHPLLWLQLVAGRIFNNPEALSELKMPDDKWYEESLVTLQKRKAKGLKNFNAAYIVSTNGKAMDKLDYVFGHIFHPMLLKQKETPKKGAWCKDWGNFLLQFQGMGSFMVNQIVTDMKYSRYFSASTTEDWTTYVLPGPGTKRGLNRIFMGDVGENMHTTFYRDCLLHLQNHLLEEGMFHGALEHLSTTFEDPNNVANCLCEWDKYQRAFLHEGKPKQLYTPAGDK